VSAIILPSNYRGQPQQAPQIDWSNPLALGLQVAWVASHPRQVLSNPGIGSVPFVTLTAGMTANARSVAVQARGVSGYGQLGPNNTFQANTWTGLVLTQTGGAAGGGTSAMFTVATAPGSGTADRSLYANSNNVAALLFDGGSKTAIGTSGAVDGTRARVMAAMSDGSSIQAWLDGHQEASTATANGGYTGYGSSAYIVLGYGAGGDGSAMDSDGRISLFLWWNRALSTAEHRAIADAPYGVFAQPKRSWLSQVAAAPPASSRPQGFIAM
jgi:hypothetical protein